MKLLVTTLLILLTFSSFSQNEECAFSDDNYYYRTLLIIDEAPTVSFDKDAFILHLDTNSNISETDSQFLNEHIIGVYREHPNNVNEPEDYTLLIGADNLTVGTLLEGYEESLDNTLLYCDCVNPNGLFEFYIALNDSGIPDSDYTKADFINYLEATSSPTQEQLDFLNANITDVERAFPMSNIESLQRALFVTANYDLLISYLSNFPTAFNYTVISCYEEVLSNGNHRNLENNIKISPNPITPNSTVQFENQFEVDELNVYDISGKLIVRKPTKGLRTVSLNDVKLNSGLYFFIFRFQNSLLLKKAVVE